MTDLPYEKISTYLFVEDDLDSSTLDFEMTDDGLTISREKTIACSKNPEQFPEIEGFELEFSIKSAIRLRNFLNHALPADLSV